MTATSSRTVRAGAPATDFEWPEGFERIPDAEWTYRDVDRFGVDYDSFDGHSWYQNLDPIIAQAITGLDEHDLLMDYSSGTGILAGRLLGKVGHSLGVLNVDASPKLLRVALEKFRHDKRVAFRLLSWLEEKERLEFLEEITPELCMHRADLLTSTNAIHLYSNLEETFASWARVVRPGGLVLICSGNVDNPNARPDEWLLDDTVRKVNDVAMDIVETEPIFEQYRETLSDEYRMAAYTRLRQKVFVPLRPLDLYLDKLSDVGFDILHAFDETVHVRVSEWHRVLGAYHDAVLGWVGGSHKADGHPPSAASVRDRLFLIKYSLEKMLPTQESFPATWTYITCRRSR